MKARRMRAEVLVASNCSGLEDCRLESFVVEADHRLVWVVVEHCKLLELV
jgi:hypothetical protein